MVKIPNLEIGGVQDSTASSLSSPTNNFTLLLAKSNDSRERSFADKLDPCILALVASTSMEHVSKAADHSSMRVLYGKTGHVLDDLLKIIQSR